MTLTLSEFSIRRRRREQPFTPTEMAAMEKAATASRGMTWVAWISVQRMAKLLDVPVETVLKMVASGRKVVLFKGWSIPKHGDQESRWVAFSNEPAEWLIKPIRGPE